MMEKVLDLILELATEVADMRVDSYSNAGRNFKPFLTKFSLKVHELKRANALQGTTFHYKVFAEDITIKRESMNYSMRDLSSAIGVSASTLSRLERGEMPDLLTYAKLCHWLEVDMNKFFN